MATLNSRIKVLVYTDAVATNNPKSRVIDIDESFSDITVDQFQPLLIKIPDLTVDQVIDLNGIEGEKLVILSDYPISVKLNGAAVGILCKILFLDGSNITSITVSNSSGQEATVRLGAGK